MSTTLPEALRRARNDLGDEILSSPRRLRAALLDLIPGSHSFVIEFGKYLEVADTPVDPQHAAYFAASMEYAKGNSDAIPQLQPAKIEAARAEPAYQPKSKVPVIVAVAAVVVLSLAFLLRPHSSKPRPAQHPPAPVASQSQIPNVQTPSSTVSPNPAITQPTTPPAEPVKTPDKEPPVRPPSEHPARTENVDMAPTPKKTSKPPEEKAPPPHRDVPPDDGGGL